MLDRILSFVLDREPVASATGIAGIITACFGVLAASGVDIDAELIAAIGVLVTAVAGWLARKQAWSPASVEELVVEKTTVAAGEAAARTAIELGRTTVGAVGDITEQGLDVVAEVIDEVTDTIDNEDVGEPK